MGTFKLQTHFVLTQILAGGSRRLLAWNARAPRLVSGDVIRASAMFEARARDAALVSEFRARLRTTEDLIGKLGYGLRELYRKNL